MKQQPPAKQQPVAKPLHVQQPVSKPPPQPAKQQPQPVVKPPVPQPIQPSKPPPQQQPVPTKPPQAAAPGSVALPEKNGSARNPVVISEESADGESGAHRPKTQAPTGSTPQNVPTIAPFPHRGLTAGAFPATLSSLFGHRPHVHNIHPGPLDHIVVTPPPTPGGGPGTGKGGTPPPTSHPTPPLALPLTGSNSPINPVATAPPPPLSNSKAAAQAFPSTSSSSPPKSQQPNTSPSPSLLTPDVKQTPTSSPSAPGSRSPLPPEEGGFDLDTPSKLNELMAQYYLRPPGSKHPDGSSPGAGANMVAAHFGYFGVPTYNQPFPSHFGQIPFPIMSYNIAQFHPSLAANTAAGTGSAGTSKVSRVGNTTNETPRDQNL